MKAKNTPKTSPRGLLLKAEVDKRMKKLLKAGRKSFTDKEISKWLDEFEKKHKK